MSRYRQSRNFEASIFDRIQEILFITNFNVTVEKTFTNAYKVRVPVIVVRIGDTVHLPAEISTTSTLRKPQILIDIFASNDGQRLDLKDCLISYLKDGIDYYEYVIGNGTFQEKIKIGRIRVYDIKDTIVFQNIDKATLDEHDRCRHLITFTASLGQVEI